MAISKPFYDYLCELSDRGIFTPGCSLLEIGQANWYGEDKIPDDIYSRLNGEADKLTTALQQRDPFAVARSVYDATIKPSRIESIDLNGQRTAKRLDLNQPITSVDLPEQFDVCINHGTAEHICNIGQVWETMHYATTQGGVMIHEAPWTGWIDHGFYSLQPTLFYDLAHANNYRIELMAAFSIYGRQRLRFEKREDVGAANAKGNLTSTLNLFVVLRKLWDEPYRTPAQGIYAGHVSRDVRKAWEMQRR